MPTGGSLPPRYEGRRDLSFEIRSPINGPHRRQLGLLLADRRKPSGRHQVNDCVLALQRRLLTSLRPRFDLPAMLDELLRLRVVGVADDRS
jgi:hypothetical protein